MSPGCRNIAVFLVAVVTYPLSWKKPSTRGLAGLLMPYDQNVS